MVLGYLATQPNNTREAHGYQNMDEYLKDIGYDEKRAHEQFLKIQRA